MQNTVILKKMRLYLKQVRNIYSYSLGERGEKFYIIIEGRVDIMKLSPVSKSMTVEQYFSYLQDLKHRQEIHILEKTIKENMKIFLES